MTQDFNEQPREEIDCEWWGATDFVFYRIRPYLTHERCQLMKNAS